MPEAECFSMCLFATVKQRYIAKRKQRVYQEIASSGYSRLCLLRRDKVFEHFDTFWTSSLHVSLDVGSLHFCLEAFGNRNMVRPGAGERSLVTFCRTAFYFHAGPQKHKMTQAHKHTHTHKEFLFTPRGCRLLTKAPNRKWDAASSIQPDDTEFQWASVCRYYSILLRYYHSCIFMHLFIFVWIYLYVVWYLGFVLFQSGRCVCVHSFLVDNHVCIPR